LKTEILCAIKKGRGGEERGTRLCLWLAITMERWWWEEQPTATSLSPCVLHKVDCTMLGPGNHSLLFFFLQ
jgi:hypothetical protein